MSVMFRFIGVFGLLTVSALQPSVLAQEDDETKQNIELAESQAEELPGVRTRSRWKNGLKNIPSDWEEWAKAFEAKMETWGKKQEVIWEKWAESYSAEWEQWGDKLESGQLKEADVKELLDRNLEMLSDMPLGELVDGLLNDGLQELKNAPWDSLYELQVLVGAIH